MSRIIWKEDPKDLYHGEEDVQKWLEADYQKYEEEILLILLPLESVILLEAFEIRRRKPHISCCGNGVTCSLTICVCIMMIWISLFEAHKKLCIGSF